MKTAGIVIFAMLMCVAPARGQNASGSEKKERGSVSLTQPTPLKVLVVISEFDGTKKIANLPYTLYTVTEGAAGPGSGPRQSMRYQLRVPVVTNTFQPAFVAPSKGTPLVNTQFQWHDVGTDIDYGAYTTAGDSYELFFTLDRSWASLPSPTGERTALENGSITTGQPILPHFRNSFVVVLKNGQTVEGASATDPVSGHVLKVEVTLTVLK